MTAYNGVKYSGKVKLKPEDLNINFGDLGRDSEKLITKIVSNALNNIFKFDGFFQISQDCIHFSLVSVNNSVEVKWVFPMQSMIDSVNYYNTRTEVGNSDVSVKLVSNFRRWANELEAKIKP